MKNVTMGHGAGLGNQRSNSKRAFVWLWRSWVEAQSEVPVLRWLGLAALAAMGGTFYLAVEEGKTALDTAVYVGITALFLMVLPVIYYLLFEIYRKHRSDAIFDSKRLAALIHQIAKAEVAANEGAKLSQENTLLMIQRAQGVKN